VAVNTTGLPLSPVAVARSVSGPAWLPSVQLPTAATPFAPLVAGLPVTLPCAGVNVTLTPPTGFPNASVTSTAGGVPTAVPTGALWLLPAWAAITAAGAAFTVTEAVWVIATPPIVAEMVFVPTPVELSVPVATPLALVGPIGCVSVLPAPLAARTTVAPLTGFPLASFAVTVIVLALAPVLAVIVPGAALTVD